jgi:tetratricopeptide (TPR) repeat protein
VRKAQAAFAQRDLAGAQRAYEEALRKAPDNVYLLSNLGVVRFRDGRFAQAEVVLKQAVAFAPNDDFSHTTLGTVYFMQGRYDEALVELDIALKLNSKNAEAHCYKGICAATKGSQGVARQELEKALSLDPNLTDAALQSRRPFRHAAAPGQGGRAAALHPRARNSARSRITCWRNRLNSDVLLSGRCARGGASLQEGPNVAVNRLSRGTGNISENQVAQ